MTPDADVRPDNSDPGDRGDRFPPRLVKRLRRFWSWTSPREASRPPAPIAEAPAPAPAPTADAPAPTADAPAPTAEAPATIGKAPITEAPADWDEILSTPFTKSLKDAPWSVFRHSDFGPGGDVVSLSSLRAPPSPVSVSSQLLPFSHIPFPKVGLTPLATLRNAELTAPDAKLAHAKISTQRGRVLRRRIKVQEDRNALRQKRTAAADTDLKVMDLLRRFIWKRQEPGIIQELQAIVAAYEESQQQRDELGPMEDDYNTQENLLDQEEYELDELEKSLYNPPREIEEPCGGPLDEPLDDDAVSDSNLSDDHSLDSDPFAYAYAWSRGLYDAPEITGVKADYLIRIGQAGYLRERVESLIFQRAQYLEDRKIRQSLNTQLSVDNEAFIAAYPDKYAAALKDLLVCEADIRSLKQSCLDEGVLVNADEEYAPIGERFQSDIPAANAEQYEHSSPTTSPSLEQGEVAQYGEVVPANIGRDSARQNVAVQDGFEAGNDEFEQGDGIQGQLW